MKNTPCTVRRRVSAALFAAALPAFLLAGTVRAQRLDIRQGTVVRALFDSGSVGFPLPFTTYVPPAMAVETAASGEGEAVRFVASPGGKRNPDAYLHIAAVRDAASERQARALARSIAASRGLRPRRAGAPPRFRWSRAEYDFQRQSGGSRQMGTVAVGRHRGRCFLVILSYPQGYDPKFVPRAQRILAEWRWKDTGRPLARE